MQHRLFISLFIFALFSISAPVPAVANPSPPQYILSHVPQAAETGSGRLTYLFWDVYDARLFAPKGKWVNKPPYALRLAYLRNLDGKAIADRSTEEMRKQGYKNEVALATWHEQMRKIFPNVDNKTVITGIHTADGEALFYKNGEFVGKVTDPEFSKYFFGIWFNEKTSEPKLRKALIGL